jgi:NAD(P)H-hydrate epimerase
LFVHNIFNKFLYKLKIKEFKSKNIEKKLIRNPNSNKGDYGHVLVIAGNLGFGGAALLASRGVLASGAGLATLASRKDHLSAAALAYCPEVMTKTVESISDLESHLPDKTVICIGPGLGRNYWADQMLI